MTIRHARLDDAGWQGLEAILNKDQARPAITSSIINALRALNAKSFIVEEEYLDRDFSEAYSSYYSKLFKRHTKICIRVTFFSADAVPALSIKDAGNRAVELEKIGQKDFLGWVILRPIHEAPIEKVVLRQLPLSGNLEGHLLVKSDQVVHVLGAELKISTSIMTQQDSRIGACAQAAIWSAARHFHLRHKGPWISTVGITEAALTQTEAFASTALPNGSESLSLNGMVTALKAIGRKPLLYFADQTNPNVWNDVRPADVINRYVDSGIPVIIGLGFPNQRIGHAVVATGQVLRSGSPVALLPPKPSRAEFTHGFYVNDDQLGANLLMPRHASSTGANTPYNLSDNATFILIPLPDKVFVPAEKAEILSWDLLSVDYIQVWPKLVAAVGSKSAKSMGEKFIEAYNTNQIVARTYLTYGWKYQYRLLRNSTSSIMKEVVSQTELPRYVWVTEFGTNGSFSDGDKFRRRIFAHCVLDATAKNMGSDCRLLFHAPGLIFRNSHDANLPHGPYKPDLFIVDEDKEYFPKLRGNKDYTGYYRMDEL
jgi:hypothetical protein